MTTILILGTAAVLATVLIVRYYRSIGTKSGGPKNFGNDGLLHLIFPK
jgi:hypothetical protein